MKKSMTTMIKPAKIAEPGRTARLLSIGEHDDSRAAEDRGAVLMILALLITILLLCAGFAIDFGSWYNRAEEMQNAADSAALAGAAEFDLYKRADGTATDQAIGNTESRILDVLRQNGIEPSEDIIVDIIYPGELNNELGEVLVSIIDRNVDLYFATFVLDRFEIRRDATAKVDKCGNTCSNTLAIPRPFSAVNVTGSGDGFAPIYLGDRVYAINHHQFNANIVCLLAATGDPCPGYGTANDLGTPIFPAGSGYLSNSGSNAAYPANGWDPLYSDLITLHEIVGSRIYITGQTAGEVKLVCWETDLNPTHTNQTGGPCPSNGSESIANLSGRLLRNSNDQWANEIRNGAGAWFLPRFDVRGYGLSFIPDDGSDEGRIFVFTDDHKVHCRTSIDINQTCSGYATPKDTGLAFDGFPAMGGSIGNASFSDRIVDHDQKRIYTTVHYTPSHPQGGHGVMLECWDAQNDEICQNFPSASNRNSIAIHEAGDPDYFGGLSNRQGLGRLFFDRDHSRNIVGVCSMGKSSNTTASVDCVELDGDAYARPEFANLPGAALLLGTFHYHEGRNRLFISQSYPNQDSRASTVCWDFGDPDDLSAPTGFCGVMRPDTDTLNNRPGTEQANDYGYSSRGNCVYALGHQNRFYTFNAEMENECDEGRALTQLFPCTCFNGDQLWGSVIVDNLDPVNNPYDSFDVYIKEQEHDPVSDAIDSKDLLASAGVVDLSNISPDYPYVWLEIVVNVKLGQDPWSHPSTQPSVIVGYSDKPHLVN